MQYRVTTKKALTRRGTLWLGQTCNLRCQFCYFMDRIASQHHPEHSFMGLDKAKEICSVLRFRYDNTSVDIQGGEPLIYKDIYSLIKYCRTIGLLPTLITNGLVLANAKVCHRIREAGVRDLLVSVHGLGEVYDTIVGRPGASQSQMKGLINCREIGIPCRFNVVLSKGAIPQYVRIAELAVQTGANVVNFIAFNPFEDQANPEKRNTLNVPKYSDVVSELTKALDVLASAGVEANVRYLPICMVPKRHRKSMYNFQQLPYDFHEWDFASWSWTGMQSQRMRLGSCSPTISLSEATSEIDSAEVNEQTSYGFSLVRHGGRLVRQCVSAALQPYPALKARVKYLYCRFQRFGSSDSTFEGDRNLVTRDNGLYRKNARLRANCHCGYKYAEVCHDCSAKLICDGFHGDYFALFGADEAKPIKHDFTIDDPCFFINEQEKCVEEEELAWLD